MPKTEKDKKQITAKVVKDGDSITVIASDETVDRHGESIPIDSWDLSHFNKDPRMMVDHDYRTEKIVGAWQNARAEGGKLLVEPRFHSITDLAKQTRAMVEEGFLSTVSVGFIPHYETRKNKAGEEEEVVRNELIEVSWVAIGANPNARVKKSLGSLLTKEVDDDESDLSKKIDAFVEKYIVVDDKATEEAEEVEVKGDVAEEVARQEKVDQKFANLREVFDVVYAMADVYLQDDVEVEEFNKLLSEVADMLKNLSVGEAKEATKDAIVQRHLEKNKDLVNENTATMLDILGQRSTDEEKTLTASQVRNIIKEELSSVLQLLAAPSEGGSETPDGDAQKSSDEIVMMDRSTLEYIQSQLRVNDRHNEASLTIIKRLLD